jgi:hypothetical protein
MEAALDPRRAELEDLRLRVERLEELAAPTEDERFQAAYLKELGNYPRWHPLRPEGVMPWARGPFHVEPEHYEVRISGEYTVMVPESLCISPHRGGPRDCRA